MDIIEEMGGNSTVLVVVPAANYSKTSFEVSKQLSGKKVCYITLNKTRDSIMKDFDSRKIDFKNFLFIDAITKTIKKNVESAKNCYYVSSPGALTEMAIVVSKALKYGFDFIIFDSLTNLLIYQKGAVVSKFLLNTVARVKDSGSKGVFYILPIEGGKQLIEESGMFFDKVINVKEKSG